MDDVLRSVLILICDLPVHTKQACEPFPSWSGRAWGRRAPRQSAPPDPNPADVLESVNQLDWIFACMPIINDFSVGI